MGKSRNNSPARWDSKYKSDETSSDTRHAKKLIRQTLAVDEWEADLAELRKSPNSPDSGDVGF